MLSGNNSILLRAGEARDETIEEQEKEQVKLAYMSAFTNNSGGKVSMQDLQDELDVLLGDVGKTNSSTKKTEVTIFVALYKDGTLVFSNNEVSIDTTKVSKSYGNIKGNDFD